MHLHTGNPDRGNDGSHLLDDLRVRAGEAADRAREVVGSRLRETRDLVEEHTGILAYSREHPTTALVGAFSTGFVLATIVPRRKGNWFVERLRRQLQALIVSGVAALVAHELRALRGDDPGFEPSFEWPDESDDLLDD